MIVYKKKYTRISLSDLFVFELSSSGFESNSRNWCGDVPGWVRSGYEEVISLQELKDRKAELETIRPDIVEFLWPFTDECLLDMYMDPNHPFYTSRPDTPPLFNPFSLTYTAFYEVDSTLEFFVNYAAGLYAEHTDLFRTELEDAARMNNTIVEQLFEDGQEILTEPWISTRFFKP